jgi:S1-C subfamily serine protease
LFHLIAIPTAKVDSVTVYSDDGAALGAAKVLWEDPGYDLAVLQLDRNPFENSQQFHVTSCNIDQSRRKDGDAVLVLGYPMDSKKLISTQGIVASAGPPLFDPPIVGEILDAYLLDVQSHEGNSGGPVFSYPSGMAVAIVRAAAPEYVKFTDTDTYLSIPTRMTRAGTTVQVNTGLTEAVPASYVVSLLRSHNIVFNAR